MVRSCGLREYPTHATQGVDKEEGIKDGISKSHLQCPDSAIQALSPEVGATNWGPIVQQMSLWRKFNIQNIAQLKYVLNHLIKIFFARTEAPVKAKSKDKIDILYDFGFSTIRK